MHSRSAHSHDIDRSGVVQQVPNALKRKTNKRDSAPHLSPAEATLFGGSASSGSGPRGTKQQDKDRERHGSKGALANVDASALTSNGPAAPSVFGRWKRVSAVLRDDGFLRLYDQVGREFCDATRSLS